MVDLHENGLNPENQNQSSSGSLMWLIPYDNVRMAQVENRATDAFESIPENFQMGHRNRLSKESLCPNNSNFYVGGNIAACTQRAWSRL